MLSLRRVQCGCGLELEIKVAEDYAKFYKAPTKAFSWLKAQHLRLMSIKHSFLIVS